ncbi:unnamed protein product [Pedinophyceae sp. YPF-701]|nr:unnamed protein product [Pedinophyceae sp. YPF-701]
MFGNGYDSDNNNNNNNVGLSLDDVCLQHLSQAQQIEPNEVETFPGGEFGGKWFNDVIHGRFFLDQVAVAFIDTPQFQRLRKLKQLGTANLVFPTAEHSRFSPSIGTGFLAWQTVSRLNSFHKTTIADKFDVTAVTLAGLCHDLGHGPFSHVFDNEFLPRALPQDALDALQWSHERMSGLLFDRAFDLVKDELSPNVSESLVDGDQRRIADMIMANRPEPGTQSFSKAWLYDIVANKQTSIDVDKLDYISRDSYYTGVKHDYDHKLLLQQARVVEDEDGPEICFRYSAAHSLHDLFMTRAKLHQTVYTHPKAKAMEFMIVDALLAANKALGITDRVRDPDDYLHLNDSILEVIENPLFTAPGVDDDPPDAGLLEAQDILRRLRVREIYSFVGEEQIPAAMNEALGKVTAEEIMGHVDTASAGIKLKEVIVQNHKIDFALRHKNPLDSVWYYKTSYRMDAHGRRTAESKRYHIPPRRLSSMYDPPVVDRRVRVFCRSRDQRKVNALREGLTRWASTVLRGHYSPRADNGGARPSDRTDMVEHRTPKDLRKRRLSARSSGGPSDHETATKRSLRGALAD